MLKLLLSAALAFCLIGVKAQTDSTKKVILISTKGDTIRTSNDDQDKAFTKVEIESEFPGGIQAWQRYLRQNLNYPKDALRGGIEGTVVLQFIVCTDGTVCNVEAISGPELLRKAALDAMKNTPNWKPAVLKGKNVKSYKKQPLAFRLQ